MKTAKNFSPPSSYNPLFALFGNDCLCAWNGDAPNSIPAMRIQEARNRYLIEMAIPGFRREDFTVYIKDNMLNISCRKDSRPLSCFFRSFPIPKDADIANVRAKYDGILHLMIGKNKHRKGN